MTWRPLSDGAVCWVAVTGEPRRGTTRRCRQHSPRERRGRTSGPSQEQKEAWGRRFSKAGRIGGLRPETLRRGRSSRQRWLARQERTWRILRAFSAQSRRDELASPGHLLQRSGRCYFTPLGICRQCLPCLWWRDSCVEFGFLEQRRWLGTTAPVLLCIRATRRAPREGEWCMCYLLWANSSSKFY